MADACSSVARVTDIFSMASDRSERVECSWRRASAFAAPPHGRRPPRTAARPRRAASPLGPDDQTPRPRRAPPDAAIGFGSDFGYGFIVVLCDE